MARHVGEGGGAVDVEGELGRHLVQSLLETRLRRQNPCSPRVGPRLGGEGSFGDPHREAVQPVAGLEQRLLAGVREQENRAAPVDPAGRRNIASDRLERDLEHPRVVDADGLDAVVHRQRPRHVVVRQLAGGELEVLRLEEIDGVVAVGLVEADDKAAGGEGAFVEGERLQRP